MEYPKSRPEAIGCWNAFVGMVAGTFMQANPTDSNVAAITTALTMARVLNHHFEGINNTLDWIHEILPETPEEYKKHWQPVSYKNRVLSRAKDHLKRTIDDSMADVKKIDEQLKDVYATTNGVDPNGTPITDEWKAFVDHLTKDTFEMIETYFEAINLPDEQ